MKFDWSSLNWIDHGRASTAIWSRTGTGVPQPGKACRVEVDLIGAGVGSADEGLDVNVHGFGLGPISLQLAPAGAFESGGAGIGAPPASPAAKVERIWSPRLFYFCYTDHSVIT